MECIFVKNLTAFGGDIMGSLWEESYPLRKAMICCLTRLKQIGFDEAGVASVSVKVGDEGAFLFCCGSYFRGQTSPELVGLHGAEKDSFEPGHYIGDDVTLHRGIFKARENVKAILMAQPLYATALAAMGKVPDY